VTSLLFPLRSSCGWFTNAATRDILERRVKNALVLYDELIFQNGRYILNVLETGKFDLDLASGSIPDDRTTIEYYTPGREATLLIGGHQLLGGPTISCYQVDFHPILHDAGLLTEHYIRYSDFVASEEVKARSKAATQADLRDTNLLACLPGEPFQKSSLVEAMHLDASLAFHLKASFTTDERAGPFLAYKNSQIAHYAFEVDLRPFVLGTLASIAFPDFSSLPWDRVGAVRESAAGRELRRLIGELASVLAARASEFTDPRDAEVLVHQLFTRELIDELGRWHPNLGGFVFDLSLNLLPLGGLVGAGTGILELVERNQSWVALLHR
jgi:hypothetical protein